MLGSLKVNQPRLLIQATCRFNVEVVGMDIEEHLEAMVYGTLIVGGVGFVIGLIAGALIPWGG